MSPHCSRQTDPHSSLSVSPAASNPPRTAAAAAAERYRRSVVKILKHVPSRTGPVLLLFQSWKRQFAAVGGQE